MKRVPIVPTVIVLLAVAIMIGLGVWQLQRKALKESILARYASAEQDQTAQRWPSANGEPLSFSRVVTRCTGIGAVSAKSGRNAKGEPGIAHIAECRTASGATARVVLGWSRSPNPAAWQGGEVTGVFLAQPKGKFDIIADPPLAGLEANAKPDPADIPNNHLAYAVQWFLFAGVALAIYALALRGRMRAG